MRTPCTLLLLAIPALASAQIPALRLTAPAGSVEVIETRVTVSTPADGPAEWFAKPDQRWVSVEPRTGVTPSRVVVRVNPAGLSAGEQRAVLRFVDDAGDELLVVPVTLMVGSTDPPTGVPPTAARVPKPSEARVPTSATAPADRTDPPPPTPLSIAMDAFPPVTRNLPYSQAIQVKGGKPPYTIRVTQGRLPMGLVLVNGALTGQTRFPGVYPIEVSVADSESPPQTVSKVLDLRVIVILQGTALQVSSPTLAISATAGRHAPGVRLGIASGAQALAWTAASDQPWLLLSPVSGTAPSVLIVVADATGLDRGVHVATVTITMDGAPNSPMRVPVQVAIR